LIFHQYLGVSGLGIGVSSGHGSYRPSQSEQILFLEPEALEILVTSMAGEKERKLPDILLKYLQAEKKEFVRDWMRGYINLENNDEEYLFCVDSEKCDDKDIWIEYVGMFDGNGLRVGENKLELGRKCGGSLIEVAVSHVDLVI
jgi:hypothetical protein